MGGIIGGVIGGIGSLFGGDSAKKASQQAAQQSLAGFNYLTSGAGAQPSGQFIQNGTQAAGIQSGLLTPGAGTPQAQSAFQNYLNSTGYNFQLQQGQNAITSSNAARGLLNSGATATALAQYGQGLGQQNFNNYLQQLNDVAQRGQQQLNTVGQAGTIGGNNAAGYTQAAGTAQGAGYMGLANTIGASMMPTYTATGAQINPANNFIAGLF